MHAETKTQDTGKLKRFRLHIILLLCVGRSKACGVVQFWIPYGTLPIISSKKSRHNRETDSSYGNNHQLIVAWLLLCHMGFVGLVTTVVLWTRHHNILYVISGHITANFLWLQSLHNTEFVILHLTHFTASKFVSADTSEVTASTSPLTEAFLSSLFYSNMKNAAKPHIILFAHK